MVPLPPAVDTDYPPLSALNDILFCPRRCFLHRVEGIWQENAHTTAGSLDHKRVHKARDSEETSGRVARGLWVVSHRLRLVGVADLVEFHRDPAGGPDVPFPIEYKRGRKRKWDNDDVQLCAQALALEETLGVNIPAGAVFHVKSKRRREVPFTVALRQETELAAARLHELLASTVAPPAVLLPKCGGCSVRSVCMPELFADRSGYDRVAGRLFFAPAANIEGG